MINLKKEKTIQILAVVISLIVFFVYQATKKDDPKLKSLLCDRLKSENLNGVLIRTSYSKRKDIFTVEIYNSDKRSKYKISDWLIESPQEKFLKNDSIVKPKNSFMYFVYRKNNHKTDTLIFQGDCNFIKLNN